MKNKNLIRNFAIAFALVSISLTGCKKDRLDVDNYNPLDDVNAASENAISTNLFDDVYKQVDYSSAETKDSCSGGKSVSEGLSNCATITLGAGEFNLTVWPKHITVDFGSTGCLGNDGRTRKGKILYTATGWMRDSGSVCTVTTDNYYVDGYKVEGTKTITNNGRNNNQNLSYHVVVTNGYITHPDGNHHTWYTDRTSEWTVGESTFLYPWDDTFSTKGSAGGVTSSGSNYTIVIDNANPLITQFGCRWIKQGKLTISVSNNPPVLVDYGNGDCDPNATATINGQTYNFVMQ